MIESAGGGRTPRLSRPLLVLVALAVATQLGLLVFVVLHNYVSPAAALHSDFAPGWVGGTLWRTLGPSHAYDLNAEAALYRQIANGQSLAYTYPNTWAPGSLLLGIPLSLLPLRAAYDLWMVLQVVLLGGAALIAATVAAPAASWRLRGTAAAAAAVSGGAIATALFAQWDAFPALGVAVAYALWSRGREGWAAAVLTILLLSGKPHLALGLLPFMVGRQSRRGMIGLACGLLLTAALDLALVQVTGMRGWVDTLGRIAGFPAEGSLSVFGLFANTLGDSAAVAAMAAVAAGLCVVSGAGFGWLSRRSHRLEVCLLGAASVSLLASPHLFGQDLALLIPPAAALFAMVLVRHCPDLFVLGVGAFSVLSFAAEYQILPLGSQRADPLVPLVLLAAAVWAGRLGLSPATARRAAAGHLRHA